MSVQTQALRSRRSAVRLVLTILRLADRSVIDQSTEGLALRLQTLDKLGAERGPGPDTGPASTATTAQRDNTQAVQ